MSAGEDGVVPAVAGLVLAAGAGRRFGGPKAVARLDDERLVDIAVRTVRAGGCDPVIVVQGAVVLTDVDAEVVDNPDWPSGMGSSLQTGLATLVERPEVGATVLLLVDTPWVGAQAVGRVIDAYRAGAAAAQAAYDGVPGHPVLLSRGAWADAARSAQGDQGARAWLRDNRAAVTLVDCEGTGDPRDVDRPEDLIR